MRLAVYCDFPYRRVNGGLYADQAFVVFLSALRRSVQRLVLVGRLDPSSEPFHYRVPDGVEFVPLPHYPALSRPLGAARAAAGSLRGFWRALGEVDAVWLLGPHPLALLFVAAATLRRRRVVLGVREDLPAYARSRHPGRRGVLAAALALAACFRALGRALPVVAVGPDLARRYGGTRGVLASSVSLVPERELDDRSRAPLSYDGELVVLSVGRLDAEKNPLLLADVLARLPERWRLVVCGGGPMRGELEERLRELGVAARAELRGYVPIDGGLLDVYRRSHAFLHVSWTEGFPQVLLEAFATRTPVVATDVGGVGELVGEAALLVPPGDADAAAAALTRLAADERLRSELVAAGVAVARRHTLEAESRRVAEFIAASAVGGRRARS